jgi:hypothetical protein
MIACGDIVGRFREIESALIRTPHSPHAGRATSHPSTIEAAELPHLC